MKSKINLVKKVVLFSTIFVANLFYAQTTYTFTNASATGSVGPTSAQIAAAYLSTNLNGSVTVTSGIQNFTVPTTGNYRIEARGAQGYGATGGKGANMSGNFTFTAGTVLKILVGQQGAPPISPGTNQYGGGGGSFVIDLLNSPFVIAGGGGGSWAITFSGLSDGTVAINGNSGANGPTNGVGGVSGSGGGTAGLADGGGGLTGNGLGAKGGMAFVNGGLGGAQYAHGGFGGGGGASSWNNRRCGGGGGYSGGGGAGSTTTGYPEGGGGGSFNGGTSQANFSGSNLGDGLVLITSLSTFFVNISQTSTITCNGLSTAALTASVSGGTGPFTYSWSPIGGTSSNASSLPAGTYTCKVTDATSAITTNTFVVTQPSSFSITASVTNSVICRGATTTLNGIGATTYTWTGGVINGIAFSPTITNSYSVTGSNALGCISSNTAVSSVTVNANPNLIALSSNSLICIGNSAILTASTTATSYTWNTGATTMSISVSPSVTTTYSVIATNTNGCIANSSVSIVVNTCTGVKEIDQNSISIYPNPTNGLFTIELNSTAQIIITNSLGEVLINSKLNSGLQNLDLQNKINGIYFIRLIQNNKQEVYKLIKE